MVKRVEASRPAVRSVEPKPAPPTPKPASARGFTADELSAGKGRALRERATAQLAATGVRAPASTLLHEDVRDGQVNCLDAAYEHLATLKPEARADTQLVFLRDTRPGEEGSDGHVLIREGGRFIDPTTGKSYASLHQFDPEHVYQPTGTVPGQVAFAVLDTKPGSPERASALAKAGIPEALRTMLVADSPASAPWRVRVTAYQGNPGNLRESPSGAATLVAPLPVDTEVEVLETRGAWYRVRTDAGQEGWILANRTAYVSGTATGEPYVMADGRDGSGATGVAHARGMVGAGQGYVDEVKKETYCLSFVQDCFGLKQVAARCPEMFNPGASGFAGTANGAWLALTAAGKTQTAGLMDPLPEGAMVFFGPTEANGNAGHVAIATGETAPDGSPMVITSGFLGSPSVKTMSLLELERIEAAPPGTVAYLGYTTPQMAFTLGTWGGAAS